ncbi:hypothetical protein GGS24DRAFT_483053 [Hypoxylon argillaceum]|nr:hypothetical protein GGS24DRAFT_483053 [Hypoxylon argillaceum]
MSRGSTIPLGLWRKYTHPKYWFNDLRRNRLNGASDKQCTTYVARVLSDSVRYTDESTAAEFNSEFCGWTATQFNQVNRRFRRELIEVIERDAGPLPGSTYTERLVQFLESGGLEVTHFDLLI